ncbi:MAG: hypothetical protein PHF14_04815 [Verrucomicrobiota bacterium]|nr:hypothetical protein [Verrucomicrobiota bacterium]MDD8050009.1 hypothetical protein [Verrucomicrobiota bacterium]
MITGSNLEAWHTQMGETTMRWVYAVLLLIAVSGWAVGAEAEETGAAAEEMVTPADPQTSVLANAETGWASRYVSEGVNWLDEGGLATMEGSLSAGPLTVGTWWGLGDSIDYQESNLFMVYGLEFSSLRASAGYNWLHYFEDDQNDHQLAAMFEWLQLPIVTPAVNYSYFTETEGGFLEAMLQAEFHPVTNSLTLQPYVLAGFDFGYVSPEYDGANHVQLGLEGSYRFTPSASMYAGVHHSMAWENLDRADLGDETWIGLGLRIEQAINP